jgi:hypothetical protein
MDIQANKSMGLAHAMHQTYMVGIYLQNRSLLPEDKKAFTLIEEDTKAILSVVVILKFSIYCIF